MSHDGKCERLEKKQGHGDACECPRLLRTGVWELPAQVSSPPETPGPTGGVEEPLGAGTWYSVPTCLPPLPPGAFGLPKQATFPARVPTSWPQSWVPCPPPLPVLGRMLGSMFVLGWTPTFPSPASTSLDSPVLGASRLGAVFKSTEGNLHQRRGISPGKGQVWDGGGSYCGIQDATPGGPPGSDHGLPSQGQSGLLLCKQALGS